MQFISRKSQLKTKKDYLPEQVNRYTKDFTDIRSENGKSYKEYL